MRRPIWIIVALVVLGVWLWTQPRVPSPAPSAPPSVAVTTDAAASAPAPAPTHADTAGLAPRYPAFLPPETHEVLQRIASDGPFPYRQDGGVFQNRERRLPPQPRGYYREYTVATPGSPDRGARRIIAGGGRPGESPPQDYWYTDDHYRSFQHFEVLH